MQLCAWENVGFNAKLNLVSTVCRSIHEAHLLIILITANLVANSSKRIPYKYVCISDF